LAAIPLLNLLTDSGCKAETSLDDWLRNGFFQKHCKRFHNRLFIWHIWDGRKDGFSALRKEDSPRRVRPRCAAVRQFPVKQGVHTDWNFSDPPGMKRSRAQSSS